MCSTARGCGIWGALYHRAVPAITSGQQAAAPQLPPKRGAGIAVDITFRLVRTLGGRRDGENALPLAPHSDWSKRFSGRPQAAVKTVSSVLAAAETVSKHCDGHHIQIHRDSWRLRTSGRGNCVGTVWRPRAGGRRNCERQLQSCSECQHMVALGQLNIVSFSGVANGR